MLWCIRKHKITGEMGLDYPRADVHRYLYEHEKACGDVFVSLALTNQLYEWEGEGDQKSGFRHDRKFSLQGAPWYLEHEQGNQKYKVLRAKLERYCQLWSSNREPFGVLFTVKDQETFDLLLSLFKELELPPMYSVAFHSQFVSAPLNCPISSRTINQIFSNHLYNQLPTA